jgi:methylated-DNA-[protein]-cysteine S-methyltransferase
MLNICWIDQQKPAGNKLLISTPAGNLAIYLIGSTITKTEWSLDNLSIISIEESHGRQIQDYLKNPSTPLRVNLQKQGTLFRNKVWSEICKIPIGEVKSYSEIAKKIGSGARAVANACRDNPFPGIIPCHRVVSVSGLGGYMGETRGKCIKIKKKLLAIESHFKIT